MKIYHFTFCVTYLRTHRGNIINEVDTNKI